jgi:hypothetical protein
MGNKRIPRRIVLCSLMVVLGVSALPNVWVDPVIDSQPSNYPDGITYASQNDTSAEGYGNYATV